MVSAGWLEVNILVHPGDGIDPEVTRSAAELLFAAATRGREFV